ncbi:hypothetical protein AVEN_150309-1 [Araneus ventricosus]|uniref:Uncharacterized protein n=1 Tax=Araneus ventricosus TaxID=182803 RepID=A0A4Y2HR30_ARAVE|nr:hypothetical protein AVEN_150309-1 [Araneus ventricosus]
MAELLDFENQMYLELFHDDALVVLAKGLNFTKLLNYGEKLKVYFLCSQWIGGRTSIFDFTQERKEAFEFLIKKRAHLVLPEGIDGKSGDHPDLERGSSITSDTVNS